MTKNPRKTKKLLLEINGYVITLENQFNSIVVEVTMLSPKKKV